MKVLSEYNIIEKSNSLVLLDKYAEIEEAPYILLDIYLSLINPREKNTKTVKFPKSDYEDLKNIKRVKPSTLEKDLQKLMISVKLPDPNDEEAFRLKPLFSECSCKKESDGQYWITMICEEEMNDYFFNISKIGYIKYRLGMMRKLNLTSRLLYNELHSHKYKKPYYLSIDELAKIMKLTTKNFKNTKEIMRKLRESVDSINDNTNLKVSFKKLINGNKEITGIDFNIVVDENQIDEDLSMIISSLMNISYEEAEPITKAAQLNKLDDDDVSERINYILGKSNVKNKIGYAIRIMSDELWNKIKNNDNNKDSYIDGEVVTAEKSFTKEYNEAIINSSERKYKLYADEDGRMRKEYLD